MRGLSVLFLLALAACGGDLGGRLLVAPGGYETWTCTQVTNQTNGYLARQKVLEALMAKAGTGLDGRIASAMAYDAEYAQNRASLESLRRAAAEKNCASTAPPKP